jgi:ubiquinone biosynthesis protein Coq4
MLSYMQPESSLTLREAIRELRLEDAKERDVAPIVAPELEQSMTAHDAVHVIFGCDTSDEGEAVAHAWMLLGTDVRRVDLHRVLASGDHRRFAREVGHWRRLRGVLSALSQIARAVRRAKRMHRRWGWNDNHGLLDTPLVEIRRRYGVKLASR